MRPLVSFRSDMPVLRLEQRLTRFAPFSDIEWQSFLDNALNRSFEWLHFEPWFREHGLPNLACLAKYSGLEYLRRKLLVTCNGCSCIKPLAKVRRIEEVANTRTYQTEKQDCNKTRLSALKISSWPCITYPPVLVPPQKSKYLQGSRGQSLVSGLSTSSSFLISYISLSKTSRVQSPLTPPPSVHVSYTTIA